MGMGSDSWSHFVSISKLVKHLDLFSSQRPMNPLSNLSFKPLLNRLFCLSDNTYKKQKNGGGEKHEPTQRHSSETRSCQTSISSLESSENCLTVRFADYSD